MAGHVCLDVIPEFAGEVNLEPGALSTIRRTRYSSGGAVSNVGRALLTLGAEVQLLGKIGADGHGEILRGLLAEQSPAAAATLRIASGESTSYTVVISAAGRDRTFLHQPGCNDGFGPDDIDLELVGSARLFYLGYPQLLRRTYADGGVALAELLARARARGVTTVLDTTLPDPAADSGRVDWRAWLARVLPEVDLFVPSLAEALFMLERDSYESAGWRLAAMPAPFVRDLGAQLLDLGVAVSGVKLGERGLYLRSAGGERLAATLLGGDGGWVERELWTPAFEVEAVGTVGAGDAALAGLMASLLRDAPPEQALTVAAAVGAASVEAADASSGVRSWSETSERIAAGWPRRPGTDVAGWRGLPSGVWEADR